ncbi:MAG: acyl carrier protein [FCB group bacterium]|nr:acyl carrier protein [FCB group bacterium]
MNRPEIDAKLEELVKDILRIDYYNHNIAMENEDNWDSLAHIQLLSAIEEEFHIEIKFQDTMEMTSIRAIISMIIEYTKSG